jgi:hypothetical protein
MKGDAKELRGGIWDDLNVKLAGTRAVEFSEKDGLPATQGKAAFLDEDGFGGADEGGLDVRIGIAFGVFILAGARDEPVESGFDVAGHGGIIAFVDEDACGGVRDVEIADAICYAGIADDPFDFLCNVLQFGAARRADGEAMRFHFVIAYD